MARMDQDGVFDIDETEMYDCLYELRRCCILGECRGMSHHLVRSTSSANKTNDETIVESKVYEPPGKSLYTKEEPAILFEEDTCSFDQLTESIKDPYDSQAMNVTLDLLKSYKRLYITEAEKRLDDF
jgi:hypothetical protein